MDGRLKAQWEIHVSDMMCGYTYVTMEVVCDTPYAITARCVLLIAAPDDLEPLAPMCGVLLMYDVALCHFQCCAIQCDC